MKKATKKVSESEFNEFINSYPRKLDKHGVNFCTPPILEWHDFSIGGPNGKPDSIVAYRVDVAGSQGDDGSGDRYYIIEPEAEQVG